MPVDETVVGLDRFGVRTSFMPIRMVAGQKEPVALHVEVRNRTGTSKNYSVSLKVPFVFGFDMPGLMREKRIRMKTVHPKESKDAIFKVYAKAHIEPGIYKFGVTVREHDERFDKELSMERYDSELRVV